jgi:cytochrome c biogenesis protein ResB
VWNKIAPRQEISGDPLTLPGYSHKATVLLPSTVGIEQIEPLFHKAGYRATRIADRLFAIKNRFSPLATLLYHLSFFLILVGGVISLYTRFTATVDLAEGETFRGDLAQYSQYPSMPKFGSPPHAEFIIEKIELEVIGGTYYGISVSLSDSGGKRHVVEVNRPYKTDNTSFVIRTLGVAPLIVLADSQNRELDGAYVKLTVLQGKRDTFVLDKLEIAVQFFPDHVERYGVHGTRSEAIKNPAFFFDIRKSSKPLGQRLVKIGEPLQIGGYRLEIREMPFWVRFYVVKEQGLGVIYAGFFVAAVALIWRLLFYRREIIVQLEQEAGQTVVHLAGRGEFYKALFEDEFDALVRTIKGK